MSFLHSGGSHASYITQWCRFCIQGAPVKLLYSMSFLHTGVSLHVVAMFAIQIRICFLCQCTSHTATYQHWSLFGEEGDPCRWLQKKSQLKNVLLWRPSGSVSMVTDVFTAATVSPLCSTIKLLQNSLHWGRLWSVHGAWISREQVSISLHRCKSH